MELIEFVRNLGGKVELAEKLIDIFLSGLLPAMVYHSECGEYHQSYTEDRKKTDKPLSFIAMNYCYREWLIHHVVKNKVMVISMTPIATLAWVKNNVVKDANDPAGILLHFALLYAAYGIGCSAHRSCFAAIVLATALKGKVAVKVFSIPKSNHFLLVMGVKNNYRYYDPAINPTRIYSKDEYNEKIKPFLHCASRPDSKFQYYVDSSHLQLLLLAVKDHFKAREDKQHKFGAYGNSGIQPAATLMNDSGRCKQLHKWLFRVGQQGLPDRGEQSSASWSTNI